MSALINVNKLKFSVFGRGYDDERGNSGEGYLEPDNIGFGVDLAEFDETGEFCWIERKYAINSPYNYKVYKYNVSDWSFADQGNVPHYQFLTHPRNVENNLGYMGQDSNGCLFDLTTNEIIKSGTVSNMLHGTYMTDCVLDEDMLRYVVYTINRANSTAFYYLNTDTFTGSNTGAIYDRQTNGFIDETHVYLKFPPEWFSQWWWAYSTNINKSNAWSLQATDADTHSFVKLGGNCWGLTGHGKVYHPSLIDGEWVMGEYDATTVPDLITPTPIKTYGHFNSRPWINEQICYSNGKKKGAFSCSEGTFVVDMINGSMTKITTTVETVRAMTDSLLLCFSGKVYHI